MMRPALLVLLLCAALAATGCTRTSEGVATAGGESRAATGSSEPSSIWGTSPTRTFETAPPDPQEDYAEPGVVPTTQTPAPAGVVCAPIVLPPVRTVAQVSDPLAPTATVAVPEGWSMSSGGGDPAGARLQGPDMSATVTIARTSLDPAAAFRDYTDNLTDGYAISTVSTLPGQMCGYSGQRLVGILSDGREGTDGGEGTGSPGGIGTVQYEDRIVHVPASAQNYLIAVHVEAPADTPGFDAAALQLTDDFEIGLP